MTDISDMPDGGWLWRHGADTEFDVQGRRVFRLHRRFVDQPLFGYLDVLLAASLAVAIVALTDSLRFEVDHIELYLRPDDAFRLGDDLLRDSHWPKWSSAAEVVDGEPDHDDDLTVVVVSR